MLRWKKKQQILLLLLVEEESDSWDPFDGELPSLVSNIEFDYSRTSY